MFEKLTELAAVRKAADEVVQKEVEKLSEELKPEDLFGYWRQGDELYHLTEFSDFLLRGTKIHETAINKAEVFLYEEGLKLEFCDRFLSSFEPATEKEWRAAVDVVVRRAKEVR